MFGRGRAGTVVAFPGIGFNERGVAWRQHAGYPAGLSRTGVPPQNL
jgi:hypothetical protein